MTLEDFRMKHRAPFSTTLINKLHLDSENGRKGFKFR